MNDFTQLVQECHDRKIKLIMKLEFNSTSTDHPWFRAAATYLRNNKVRSVRSSIKETEGQYLFYESDIKKCPYLDYYIFSKEAKEGYIHIADSEWYYEANTDMSKPELNLDSEKVRRSLEDVAQFWISHGVDGFSLKSVSDYYGDDDDKTIEFLTWFNTCAKEKNPDLYIVGEAKGSSTKYEKYYASGIDSFFDYDYTGEDGFITRIVNEQLPASQFSVAMENTEGAISLINKEGIDAPFYANRFTVGTAGYYMGENAESKTKIAAALNMLMTGNVFVYFGEELGMPRKYIDADVGNPMYWTDVNSPNKENAALVKGMCEAPAGNINMKYDPFDEQVKDKHSIYSFYKDVMDLRNMYPVIARGRTRTINEISGQDVCAFTRSLGQKEIDAVMEKCGDETAGFGPDKLLIVVNTGSGFKDIDLSKCEKTSGYKKLIYTLAAGDDVCRLSGTQERVAISLPAYSIAVLSCDE